MSPSKNDMKKVIYNLFLSSFSTKINYKSFLKSGSHILLKSLPECLLGGAAATLGGESCVSNSAE